MFAHTSLVRRAARAAATGALRASANRACVATTRAVAFRGATVACHGISTAVHACQTDTASTSGSAATAGDVIYDVDTTSFQSKVMMSDVPVLLDCYAEYVFVCSCRPVQHHYHQHGAADACRVIVATHTVGVDPASSLGLSWSRLYVAIHELAVGRFAVAPAVCSLMFAINLLVPFPPLPPLPGH